VAEVFVGCVKGVVNLNYLWGIAVESSADFDIAVKVARVAGGVGECSRSSRGVDAIATIGLACRSAIKVRPVSPVALAAFRVSTVGIEAVEGRVRISATTSSAPPSVMPVVPIPTCPSEAITRLGTKPLLTEPGLLTKPALEERG